VVARNQSWYWLDAFLDFVRPVGDFLVNNWAIFLGLGIILVYGSLYAITWALNLLAILIWLLQLPYELTSRLDSSDVTERIFILVGTIATLGGIVWLAL
jgi:hypothetical protein